MKLPILFHRLAVAATVAALLGLAPARAADGRNDKEKAAIAVLRSDAAEADKALACKQLAIFGSADAVPDLAKLLDNERLHSWARTGLEAIPGPEADAALRAAAATLSGQLLVGTINSIGVRKDAGAQQVLTQRLADRDPEVASAAAVALGHVGTLTAVSALKAALPRANGAVQSAIAEGCILAAEGLLAAGKGSDAAADKGSDDAGGAGSQTSTPKLSPSKAPKGPGQKKGARKLETDAEPVHVKKANMSRCR